MALINNILFPISQLLQNLLIKFDFFHFLIIYMLMYPIYEKFYHLQLLLLGSY